MTNKYTSSLADVFSVFNSVTWKAENITTYPENFASGLSTEFIRVTTLLDRTQAARLLGSIGGRLMIDIFTPAGSGPSRALQIADKLDSYLVGKQLSTTSNGNTQFGTSTLSTVGIDKDNPSLYRNLYSIPFNFFGV